MAQESGIMIPSLGENMFVGTSNEGVSRRLTAQVCEVNKGLLSVSKIAKGGSRVVFDSDEAYIEDKHTLERMYLKERNGMYMLTLWAKKGFWRQSRTHTLKPAEVMKLK